MFTGIIEEMGVVREITGGGEWGSIEIGAGRVLKGTKIGDSIAVNGVCLTVTRLGREGFTADIMVETMRRTNLGAVKRGETVNLERAMAAEGRFGGHMVSGHIDGVGVIREQKREGNAVRLTVEAPIRITELILEKGSVAVDGVSLTVASVGADWFQVGVIPHTGGETTLLSGRVGRRVNLENDIVGKYIKKLLEGNAAGAKLLEGGLTTGERSGGITLAYLRENGF